jgi:hypothetical protein
LELRKKLLTQTAAYKTILLGFMESTHQYRVWNIRSSYIQLVRDVTFDKKTYPAAASIDAYKQIFPQKPLPEALTTGMHQYQSLDIGKNPIQPSLEPEKETIDRRQEANEATATPRTDTQIEPEPAANSVEPEAMEVELPQGTTLAQVHRPSDVLVDDEKACMQNTAPAKRRTASEMKNPPADSPSSERLDQTNTNPSLDETSEDTAARRSERLKSKPRRRWDSRMHFARASRATARQTVSNSPDAKFDPQSLREAMASPFSHEWGLAIEEELTALEKNNTWNTVTTPPADKKPIGNKWVFKRKLNPDNSTRYKARLVAKGYEQRYGIDFRETFAPVVNPRIVRVLLALAAALDLHIHQMDVKTAFLNGELEEEVYMELPEGCQKHYRDENLPGQPTALKLNKSLYGLKQAPRVWNKSFHAYLTSLGFKQSQADNALYIRRDVIIIVYVDDLEILSTNLDVIKDIKLKLQSKYEMTDLGETKRFLGVEISKKERTIQISQTKYIDEILH